MTNVWLHGVAILALLAVAFVQGVHAWDGGSYRAAAWAIAAMVGIGLLCVNIARSRRKN